ncbi:MAG TPA: NAD(P)-dependent alcohol dehydrogenase [Candidatus Dormibacteraeota bacterium]|nr:NAD(P)-dependent alcohol dehydrogenase [Candidatus Dormibacteraeota bacterium]
MRAVVYHRYGPPEVLHIDDVPRPTPKPDEVLVKVHAVAVTRADCETRSANRRSGRAISVISRLISGVRAPRQPILGKDYSGEVVEVGSAVTRFKVGDEVFGSNGFRFRAFAEYVAAKETAHIALKPRGSTHVEAAAVTDGGIYALTPLRAAHIEKGQKVLVYGASGAIGTAGVQLAKHFGAEVTAVCNTKNLELVKSLGADQVIDYKREDFTRNGVIYDVIFDAVGKHSFRRCEGSLKNGGCYLPTDKVENMVLAMRPRPRDGKRVLFPLNVRPGDVSFLRDLVEAGEFRPVIDRTYPFEDVVEAARYVDTEQKVGNVILTVA